MPVLRFEIILPCLKQFSDIPLKINLTKCENNSEIKMVVINVCAPTENNLGRLLLFEHRSWVFGILFRFHHKGK